MDEAELLRNIQSANNEFIKDEPVPEPAPEQSIIPAPVDTYAEARKIEREYDKKQFPHGASATVMATVADVINGVGTDSLAQAYNRAKEDSGSLKSNGEKRRAQIVENQYMLEHFLPAVEVVVNFTSPDELLNSREGLKTLDKYAMGPGAMTGYTAAYIREAYGNALGQVKAASSPEVSDAVRKINGYLDTYQSTLARGYAERTKKKVDEGKTIASDEDYNFLLMVAKNWPGE